MEEIKNDDMREIVEHCRLRGNKYDAKYDYLGDITTLARYVDLLIREVEELKGKGRN